MMDRIFSGMRPTGKLHIGHLAGALTNWVKLQDDYDCYYGIVDWHALMSDYADTSSVKDNCREVLLDWLGAGLDPQKCSIFVQSHVVEHAELALALGMITPLGWLERNPTYKEQILNLQNKDLGTYAFLGYPVLMAADILLYRAAKVPVGEDQSAHLEITREIARRFNFFYGQTFPEPETLLTPTPKVPGTDGRKMSKSYGNSIMLGATAEETAKLIKKSPTDSERRITFDPIARPQVSALLTTAGLVTGRDPKDIAEEIGDSGAGALKKYVIESVNEFLAPHRERRAELAKDMDSIRDILHDGNKRANEIANETLQQVRDAMGMRY